MNKNYLFKFYIMLAAFVMSLTACTDYDNDFDAMRAQYEENWKDVFGDIDPNQDWNMAQQVTATINMPEITGQVNVKIYENNPLATVNAKYLTDIDINGGHSTWKFDAPKGDKELYVKISQNDKTIFKGFTALDNGTLNITKASLHALATPRPRLFAPMGSGIGELKWTELCFEPTTNSDGVLIDRSFYQNCVRQIKIESDGYVYYSSDITSKPFRKLAYNNDEQDGYHLSGNRDIKYADGEQEVAISSFDLMTYVTYEGGKYKFKSDVHYAHQAHIAKTYAINETALPTLTDDTKWLIGDCKDLFWEGDAPFAEGKDYRDDNHKALYAKYGTSVEEIEKEGVIFTTSKVDSEIEIPMMYGATDKYNILGYYYYETDQDPRDVNRYILFDDARPATNIKVDNVAVTGMQLQQKDSKWKDESVVTCKTRKLMYFGRNGELNGTTKFPEGVKIAFFIRRHADTYNTGGASLPGDGGWAFSDPALNYKHIYDAEGPNLTFQGTNWTYRGSRSVGGINSDTGRGNVKAITWSYNDRILVGFGDDTGDCDLNDFVFWVNGDIKEKPKVKVDTKTKEDVYEWVVACEDLGSADDYDFNDVVFGVKHYKKATNMYEYYYDGNNNLVTTVPTVIEKKNYLVVTPYAAGGTLKSNIAYKAPGALDKTNLGEIHSLLNERLKDIYATKKSGEMDMLNTRALTCKGNPYIITLAEDDDFSASNNMDRFSIYVQADETDKGRTVSGDATWIEAPNDGAVPQMLILPCGWDWPSERTSIAAAYPGFENWSADATITDWNNNKKGSTIQNPYKTSSTSGGDDGGSGSGSGSSTELPEHSFALTIGSTDVTDKEYEVKVGTKIDNLGLPSDNGFTITSLNPTVAVVTYNDNAGNAYNHPIQTKATGTAVIRVTKDADATHKLTTHTVTLKVVEQTSTGGGDTGSTINLMSKVSTTDIHNTGYNSQHGFTVDLTDIDWSQGETATLSISLSGDATMSLLINGSWSTGIAWGTATPYKSGDVYSSLKDKESLHVVILDPSNTNALGDITISSISLTLK